MPAPVDIGELVVQQLRLQGAPEQVLSIWREMDAALLQGGEAALEGLLDRWHAEGKYSATETDWLDRIIEAVANAHQELHQELQLASAKNNPAVRPGGGIPPSRRPRR